jgi:hypothetical protein
LPFVTCPLPKPWDHTHPLVCCTALGHPSSDDSGCCAIVCEFYRCLYHKCCCLCTGCCQSMAQASWTQSQSIHSLAVAL